MKKIMLVLMAMMLSLGTSAFALDIMLEDYENAVVGSYGGYGNPNLDYITVGTFASATIQGDASNKYNEITFDNTSTSGGWGFAVVPLANFIYPLDMTDGSSISFDINVSALSGVINNALTPELIANAYDPNDGSFLGTQAFHLDTLLDLSISGWTTLTFDADDVTGGTWKDADLSRVWAVNVLFTNLDGFSGTIGIDNIQVMDVTVIPEPASIMLLIGAVAGLFIKKVK